MKRFSLVITFTLTLLLVAIFANGLVEASRADTHAAGAITETEYREQRQEASETQETVNAASAAPVSNNTCSVATSTRLSCLQVIPVPVPELVDTCGPDNAFWKATDSATVDWSINQESHLIATTKQGFIFEGGKTTIDFGKAVDSNEPCIVEIPVPVPELVDTCGPDNAFWKATDTDTVDWSINQDIHLIATTKTGYIFEGGKASIDFGKAVDSNEPCTVTL